jgi:PRTRC genetic system protein C
MALETQALTRAFRYNSVDLADPGAAYTPSQVRDFYAAVYPEITTAAIEGPEIADGKMTYEFRRAVGTKGAEDQDPLHAYFETWVRECFPVPLPEDQARCVEMAFFAGVAGCCNELRAGKEHADLQQCLATHIKRFAH